MNCHADEGVNMDRYIEHGSLLLKPAKTASFTENLEEQHTKLAMLKLTKSKLADHLEFLADFHLGNLPRLEQQVRTGTLPCWVSLQSLIWCPTMNPGAGYLDDAAELGSLPVRHASVFENHCHFRRLNWMALAPAYHVDSPKTGV